MKLEKLVHVDVVLLLLYLVTLGMSLLALGFGVFRMVRGENIPLICYFALPALLVSVREATNLFRPRPEEDTAPPK